MKKSYYSKLQRKTKMRAIKIGKPGSTGHMTLNHEIKKIDT